ncbi:MAG TPA: GTPase HflX [Rhodospirillales bacterium]
MVVHPRLKLASLGSREDLLLAEAVGLARAIDLDVVHTEMVALERRRPSTLLGSGVVERLGWVIAGDGNGRPKVAVAVVDAALTPVQQRNLERAWKCKVVDRTGLIIEIFAARARTREGRLQVELASLTYQKSRLVRTWTHLERQRGGTRALGGPGETQIESDRRQIGERITRVKRELGDVKRTRQLHRQARRRVPYPVVALVGYTNTGKSTLFNRLTRANVHVEDQLFATLDPTMRALDLPSGRTAILSDTVGFLSRLPHELVNAFHATLEEVVEADLIVHVRDAAHPDQAAQKSDVLSVLRDIGLGGAIEESLIEALNKIDLLPAAEKQVIVNRAARSNTPVVPLSAVTGEGCGRLIQVIDERVTRGDRLIEVSLKHSDGAAVAWLYDHGEVVEREDAPDAIHLKVRLDPAHWERFRQRLQ